jgi:hypothetical protein
MAWSIIINHTSHLTFKYCSFALLRKERKTREKWSANRENIVVLRWSANRENIVVLRWSANRENIVVFRLSANRENVVVFRWSANRENVAKSPKDREYSFKKIAKNSREIQILL